MPEKLGPTIQSDTLRTTTVEHRQSSTTGRRLVVFGKDNSVPPIEYVFLGSAEQLLHFIAVEQHLDDTLQQGTTHTMQDIFRLQPTFPSHLIRETEKILNIYKIKTNISKGEQILEGPAVAPTALGEKPRVIVDTTGMWGPVEYVLGKWKKSEPATSSEASNPVNKEMFLLQTDGQQ